MNILVTGGLGFIGSHFVDMWREKYPSSAITIYDKVTYAANRAYMKEANDRGLFPYRADICDREALTRAIRMYNIDLIVNFAAETHVDNSIDSQDAFLQSNYIGVGRLLDTIRAYNIPMIQVSTDEVYGSIMAPSLAYESHALKPSSPYAASKAAADLLCLAHAKTYGTKVIVTRACNNYGPRQHIEKFIPKAITCGLKGEAFPLYGNGENRRTWLHVKDHCNAIIKIIELDKCLHSPGQVINIGSNEEYSNLDILYILNKGIKVDYLNVKDRPGHDQRYAISHHRMKLLGWYPSRTFENSIKEMVAYYEKTV